MDGNASERSNGGLGGGGVSLKARIRAAATLLLSLACSAREPSIGGAWSVVNVPARSDPPGPARRNLLRRVNGRSILVASFIGHARYYDPDCVGFEQSRTATLSVYAFREIDFVCGDRTPAAVAVVSARGIRFDPDGIRPEPGVVMNASPGPGRGLVPSAFVPLADLRTLAAREGPNPRAATAMVRQVNGVVTWTLYTAIGLLLLAVLIYRRRYGLRRNQ
jgi:hypothetical protein